MPPTLLSHNSTGRTLEWALHYLGGPHGQAAGQGGALQDCSQPHLRRALQACAEKPGTVTPARTTSTGGDLRPGPSTPFQSSARNEWGPAEGVSQLCIQCGPFCSGWRLTGACQCDTLTCLQLCPPSHRPCRLGGALLTVLPASASEIPATGPVPPSRAPSLPGPVYAEYHLGSLFPSLRASAAQSCSAWACDNPQG